MSSPGASDYTASVSTRTVSVFHGGLREKERSHPRARQRRLVGVQEPAIHEDAP